MSPVITQRSIGTLLAAGALALGLLGWPPASEADALPGAPSEGWAHWNVAQQAGTGEACCYEAGQRRGCRLAAGDGHRGISLQMNDAAGATEASSGLQVWAWFENGRATRVRALSASCPVQAEGPVHALAAIDQDTSTAWLVAQVDARAVVEEALIALALHEGEAATAALVRFTGAERDPELRRDAAFWLGQARSESGLPRLLELARGADSAEFMRHLAFVLSQSPLAPATDELRRLARQHPHPDVRGQALFWLAESGAKGAEADILAALRTTEDTELVHQAVFALSQLEDGDIALIRLIESDAPRQAKRQALFWLGQSGSAQALSFLDRYLGGQR